MKNKAITLLILLSCSMFTSYAQHQNTEVTYVGNAGFLIQVDDKKILIDALFKGFEGDFIMPQDIQDKLCKAQAPFDGVDLILVTHAHGDHVDLDMVRQHMQNNPKAKFASTQQLVNVLNDSSNRWIGFEPTIEKSASKLINDIQIESFYLPHGSNARIINIGFHILVNGVSIFQTGDADFDQFTLEEFKALQLVEKKIDLAFIQHYYMRGDSLSTSFLEEAINGKYIFPIHYHYTSPAFDSSIIRQHFPEAIIFNEALDSWEMPLEASKTPILQGAYLGQTPPKQTALVFAPGIISVDSTIEHGSPTFSPDGKEVFWQSNYRQKGKETQISGMTMRCIGNLWTLPEKSLFHSEPVISPDGNRLYFLPLGKENGAENGPYYVEKKDDGWSEPICMNLLRHFPEIKHAYNYSITSEGVFYFLGHAEGLGTMHDFGIYRMPLNQSKTSQPELLPSSINQSEDILNWTPFIAPDESYLLFSSSRHQNQQDIFISFRNSDGSWTEAYRFGEEINTLRGERYPRLSPDGKYLFFTRWIERGNEDVMWISAQVIDQMRNKIMNDPN